MNKKYEIKNGKDLENKVEIKRWIMVFTIGIVLGMFLRVFIFNVVLVQGSSMNPTLYNNDKLILNKVKVSLRIEEFKKGDMVSFKPPGEKVAFVKRIVALGGDEINIENGEVYVNGEKIKEDYIADNTHTEELTFGSHYSVPKGHVFVIGDNREPYASYDSRDMGSIPISLLEGKMVMQVVPFEKFGKIGE